MAVEDLTTYEEVQNRRIETQLQDLRRVGETIAAPILNARQEYIPKDFMRRIICPGDILIWKTERMHSEYRYGLVLDVNNNEKCLKIRNQNYNVTTLWNTWNCIILAQYPDYDSIPADYLQRLGIETF